MSEKVLLGRIGGAHGLRGEVKIATFTAAPEDVAAYGPLTNAEGTRSFEIASLRSGGGGTVIARLRGISDRNAAEALRGIDLYVAREALPPPEDDEFYFSDLIGLKAISSEGEAIGEIVAVQNYGAGDLLEVRFTGERNPALIPFERAHVPKVDLEAGEVTIVKPIFEMDESAGTE
jgi:16S rRNA processing protein RimM